MRGFTLLEVMVALVIFSLMSLGALSVFSNLMRSQEALEAEGAHLEDLQHWLVMTRHDIGQAVPRLAAPPQNTGPVPALTITASGPMSFVRSGWRNPLDERRSRLAFLRYDTDGGDVVRRLLPFAQATLPQPVLSQRLCRDVSSVGFRGVSGTDASASNITLPAAVEVTLTLPPFGEVRQLVPLVQTP